MAQTKEEYMAQGNTWQVKRGQFNAWETSMQAGMGSGAGMLRYPLTLGTKGSVVGFAGEEPDESANYMKFYLNKIANTSIPGALRYEYAQYNPNKNPWTSVSLPIPVEGLTSSYAQGWDKDDIAIPAAVGVAAASQAMDQAMKAAGPDNAGTAAGAAARTLAGAMDIYETGREAILGPLAAGTKGKVGRVASSLLKNNATAYNTQFEQEALGVLAVGADKLNIGKATQYATGARAFNQTVMSYGGPSYRKFDFKYNFRPQSAAEQQEIYNIIKFFKLNSAPVKWSNDITRVYDLPGVFKIKFFFGSEENTWMNRIGVCALSNIGVNYGGAKFTTYVDGTPIETQLTLSFQELELVVRETEAMDEFDPQIRDGY